MPTIYGSTAGMRIGPTAAVVGGPVRRPAPGRRALPVRSPGPTREIDCGNLVLEGAIGAVGEGVIARRVCALARTVRRDQPTGTAQEAQRPRPVHRQEGRR